MTKDVLKGATGFGTLIGMQTPAEFLSRDSATSTTHPQYRQIAVIIYSCVLFVGIFDFVAGRPPTSSLPIGASMRLFIFCAAILAMCALEWVQQSRQTRSWISPALHLVLVTLLSGIPLPLSNANYGQLLLLIPILFAELTFDRWVSYLTIFVVFGFRFMRAAFGESPNFISVVDMQALLIFSVLIILIWLMARLIKSEWSNRLDLQTLHSELKESSAQLAQMAVINERNRLARDIHDSVGHHLAAVSIQLEMASKLHEGDPDTSLGAIHQAQAATQDALKDVRKSVGALRQSDETFELVPAVELLISRVSTDQCPINYRLDGDAAMCTEPMRLVFFRAIQEGLTNVHKHADASRINLWLQFLPQQARLRIIDDGVGFNPQHETNGTGLKGIRERVEAFGGTLNIESRLNEGTFLDIILPQPTP